MSRLTNDGLTKRCNAFKLGQVHPFVLVMFFMCGISIVLGIDEWCAFGAFLVSFVVTSSSSWRRFGLGKMLCKAVWANNVDKKDQTVGGDRTADGATAWRQTHAVVASRLEDNDPQGAADAMMKMFAMGSRPSSKTIGVVMDKLTAANDVRAGELLRHMVVADVPVDGACFQMFFERCVPLDNDARLMKWMHLLESKGSQDLTQGYIGLLRACAARGSVAQAEEWMNRAVEAGVKSTHCHNAAIHACARAGDPERAEAWLRHMVSRAPLDDTRAAPDIISYSTVMDAFAQRGDTDRAEAWFRRMVVAGIRPDRVSFNTLVKAHARNGNVAGAERWLRKARESEVQLDPFGYNSLISAAARSSDPEVAENWLRLMVEDGVQPNVISYNAVIRAHADSGNAEKAELLVQQMCDADIEPDVVTLGSAVHVCAKAGDVIRARNLFKKVIQRGKMKPDAICYNTLIAAFVKAGDRYEAERCLFDMLDDGIAPSVVSYTTLIHAHAAAGDVNAAEKGLERMLQNGIEANVVSYSSVIQACMKVGDLERAEKWFATMRKHGISANAICFSVLLNACAKASDPDRAEHWLQVMHEEGVTPNVVCYNNVIDACAKAGKAERAEVWLDKLMRMPGIQPSRQSYTTAARAWATLGAWSDTERILADMEAKGLSMDEYSLTVLMSAYLHARPRQRDRAETAFRKYVLRGLKVTKPPQRALRSLVGASRFKALCNELGVDLNCDGPSAVDSRLHS